jgi:hypothetical protein
VRLFVVMTPAGLPAGVMSSPELAWGLAATVAAHDGRDPHDYPVYQLALDLSGFVGRCHRPPRPAEQPDRPRQLPADLPDDEDWPPDCDIDSELE